MAINLLEQIHERSIRERRIRKLCGVLTASIPRNDRVLDVGCGDGVLDSRILQARPDLVITGLDVLLRDKTYIPVELYDGHYLPYADSSFDTVMFVDVLHHSESTEHLLLEAIRLTRKTIIIKDHLKNGLLAGPTLRLMDNIGNRRFKVELSYNYWPRNRWLRTIAAMGLSVYNWKEKLAIYRGPMSLFFDRSLHFVAILRVRN